MTRWHMSWLCKDLVKWFWDWETLIGNRHVEKYINGFESAHDGSGFGIRNIEGRMLLEICDEKDLCVANTWFYKKERRKVTFKSGDT